MLDIDEVAGLLAQAVQRPVRSFFAWTCPKAGQVINRLSAKPFVTPRHVDAAVSGLAAVAGGGVLLAGTYAAVLACRGASDNARLYGEVNEEWRLAVSQAEQLVRPAAPPGGSNVAAAADAARTSGALREFAWAQQRIAQTQRWAAWYSAGGAVAMAATLLLNPGLLGARRLGFAPLAGVAGPLAMQAAVTLMGSYAVAQAKLGLARWTELGRLHTELTSLPANHPAHHDTGYLALAVQAARRWQLGVMAGGAALALGLAVQLFAPLVGVAILFAGSLTLEYARLRAERQLPALHAATVLRANADGATADAEGQSSARLDLGCYLALRHNLDQARPPCWTPGSLERTIARTLRDEPAALLTMLTAVLTPPYGRQLVAEGDNGLQALGGLMNYRALPTGDGLADLACHQRFVDSLQRNLRLFNAEPAWLERLSAFAAQQGTTPSTALQTVADAYPVYAAALLTWWREGHDDLQEKIADALARVAGQPDLVPQFAMATRKTSLAAQLTSSSRPR